MRTHRKKFGGGYSGSQTYQDQSEWAAVSTPRLASILVVWPMRARFQTNAEYDHAFAIRDEMYGQMEKILRASGAEIFPYQKASPYPLGSVTHEAGGCMGGDPKTSVLDSWNRCHDIKNLLVVGASCFVTS